MHVPPSIQRLFPEFILKAQATYDAWDQDDHGIDEVVGAGGICDLIAGGIAETIVSEIPDADARCEWSEMDTHTSVLVAIPEGVFAIDIPYRVYETGFGYAWKKIPGVTFGLSDIHVMKLSDEPRDIYIYSSEGGGDFGP